MGFTSKEIANLNWTHWLTYIDINALINYHTGYVVAIYTVLQIIGGILLSSVFFDEFSMMKWYQLLLFFFGTILSFVGVGVIAYDDEHHQKVKKQKTQKKLDGVPLEEVHTDNITVDDS